VNAYERSLRRLGYGYIRKRQAASEEKLLVGKPYHRIKKEDLAQALAACEIDGYVARSSNEKLFDEDMYKKLFSTQEPFFYLARYWLAKQVKAALPKQDERREARWLVVSFVWSRLAPLFKGTGQLRAFSEQCQHAQMAVVDPVQKAIDITAKAVMKFYQATKGKGVEVVDLPTFFKSKRASRKEFEAYLKSSGSTLPGFEKQMACIAQATVQ